MVSESIQKILPALRRYLATQPVARAWLFGSCSRGEETPDSDLDLMVAYDRSRPIGLFKIGRMISDLNEIVGKQVDLVEHGRLRPFAQASADKDKILIYER